MAQRGRHTPGPHGRRHAPARRGVGCLALAARFFWRPRARRARRATAPAARPPLTRVARLTRVPQRRRPGLFSRGAAAAPAVNRCASSPLLLGEPASLVGVVGSEPSLACWDHILSRNPRPISRVPRRRKVVDCAVVQDGQVLGAGARARAARADRPLDHHHRLVHALAQVAQLKLGRLCALPSCLSRSRAARAAASARRRTRRRRRRPAGDQGARDARAPATRQFVFARLRRAEAASVSARECPNGRVLSMSCRRVV